MNFIDIILIIPIAWFAYKGFKRGLVLEVFSLLALFVGIYIAIHFSDFASNVLNDNFKIQSEYLPIVSFVATFLVVVVAVHLLGKMVSKVVKTISLDWVNKIFGTLFSTLKITLFLGVVLGFLNTTNEKLHFISDEKKQESLLFLPIIETTEKVLPAIKESKYYEQFLKWKEESAKKVLDK